MWLQCEERVEDYRFRHGGSRVVCSLGLIYSEASGLVLERSGADCSTDAGQVIRPEGGCQLAAQKLLSYSAANRLRDGLVAGWFA